MPVNSGSRPGAPLGGHSTKFAPLPEDPVAVAAPAVDPVDAVDPPPPRLPPPPPPPPDAAAPPVVVEAGVEPGEVVEFVEDDVVVVPAVGVDVVDEFWTLGNATAPPPTGNPLRCAALPTAPLVGVAEGAVLWAAAAAASAVDSSKANPAARIMAE